MFVCGQNSFQQLESSSNLRINQPKEIKIDFKTRQCCLNWSQRLILTEEGKVIINGLTKENKTTSELNTNMFFVSISTSFSYSAAVSSTKKIFLWKNYDLTPMELKTSHKIEQVSLSDNSILYLTSEGKVFHSNLEEINFVQLKGDIEYTKIQKITSGSSHSVFIDEKGDVYSYGWNGYGQCAFDVNLQFVELPKKIELLENFHVKKVSCGSHHTLFLTGNFQIFSHFQESGDLYSCGDNKDHQLGIEESCLSFPVLVEDCLMQHELIELENVVDIDCGLDHSIIATNVNGTIVLFGTAKILDGKLQTLSEKKFQAIPFAKMTRSKIPFVSCGYWNFVVYF